MDRQIPCFGIQLSENIDAISNDQFGDTTLYGCPGDLLNIIFSDSIVESLMEFNKSLLQLQRDFTYVDDMVNAIEKLIDLGFGKNSADIVNIGHCNPVRVVDFLHILSECLNMSPIVEMAPEQVSDVPLTCASDEKLSTMIGPWPHTSLRSGLEEMTQWLKSWQPL